MTIVIQLYDKKYMAKNRDQEYRQFMSARLENYLHEWLAKEKKKYETWNKFFKEIKKRYEDKK
jgi:hypothetical protein